MVLKTNTMSGDVIKCLVAFIFGLKKIDIILFGQMRELRSRFRSTLRCYILTLRAQYLEDAEQLSQDILLPEELLPVPIGVLHDKLKGFGFVRFVFESRYEVHYVLQERCESSGNK